MAPRPACSPRRRGAPGPHEDRCVLARGSFLSPGSSDHLGAATEEDPGQAHPHRTSPSQALHHSPSPAPDSRSPAPYRGGPRAGEASPTAPITGPAPVPLRHSRCRVSSPQPRDVLAGRARPMPVPLRSAGHAPHR